MDSEPNKILENSNDVISQNSSSISANESNANIIRFSANDKHFCHKISGKNVKIICSSGHNDHGSSKVKLKNIVDYKWEIKKYPGHLIAVHMDGIHIAYVIKVNNKQTGNEEGMVRVVNTQSSQRALIKGIIAEVLDVQFAQIERVHILACIDLHSLYIHKIDMLSDNLICNLLLKIEDPNYSATKYNKISWCPFYQVEYNSSDDEGDDASQLIVWSRGKMFQCFNVNIIINSHGVGKHNPKDLTDGYLQSIDNSITITWVSLSPDGTTLCAGSEDGLIRFYQVYFHEKQPRCLHQWKPHDGKPISSFFFLDNYLKKSSETFWKHALTGSNNNTEFKIWDCGTWECLQKIQLVPEELYGKNNELLKDQQKSIKELNLIAEIDITSSYLVLSNIDGRSMYILQIGHEFKKNAMNSSLELTEIKKKQQQQRQKRKNITYIRSVSEFPLSSPILSYSIVNATIRKLYKCALNDSYLLDEIDYDYEEENMAISCVVVRMFVVQPKSVQECNILYQPINANDEDEEVQNLKELNDEYLSDEIKNDTSDEDMLVIKGLPYKDVLVSGYPNKKSIDRTSASPNSIQTGGGNVNDSRQNVSESVLEKSSPLHIDDSVLAVKQGRKSISPLIPGLTHLETLQASTETTNDIPTAQSAINHAPKSHFSQINLMTPDEFHSPTSNLSLSTSLNSTNPTSSTNLNISKKSPADSVNSDVLSTILMLASVTGTQNQKQNAENLNLLYLMNNKMIEDQELQKQIRKTSNPNSSNNSSMKMEMQQLHQSGTTNKNQFISLNNDDDDNENCVDEDEDDMRAQNNSGNLTSGGSSPPSREVQEILSLKEYECKLSNFSYNEQQDLIGSVDVENLPQAPENFLNTSEMINTKTQQLLNSGAANKSHNLNNDFMTKINNTKDSEVDGITTKKSTNENNLINWPKVPDINIVGNKQKHHIVNANDEDTMLSNYNTTVSNQNNTTEQYQDISLKLDKLLDVIHVQSSQIKELKTELNLLKNQKETNTINNKQAHTNFAEFSRQIERQINKLFEQNLNRCDEENRIRYVDFLGKFDASLRDIREFRQNSQLQFNQMFEKISKVIKTEIQNKILPVVVVKLETIQTQFKTDIASKITSTDHALRESISQLCQSKSIIDTFGKSVLLGVQGSLQAAFVESMTSTLIPAYEKSSQSMFRQLHETFSFGIKQVMEQFDMYLQHLQPVQDSTEAILARCMQIREQLETNVSQHSNNLSETMIETKKDIKALEKSFIQNFSEIIKREIRKSFEQQVATLEDSVLSVVRSQTNTPAPQSQQVMSVYDVQDQIKHLLSTGQINAAFHNALLANNLNLVEYTLEKADYSNVFNPCVLEQTVLLSLIQQISADMSQHNDIKQQYLADGLLNLNQNDPITKEHAPKVMKELIKNCQLFLTSNPRSSLVSNVRMIMMASQGMGYKF